MKQRKGRKRSNRAKNLKNIDDDEDAPPEQIPPRSFIIHQGNVGSRILELVEDFKRILKPNTAEKLKARKYNKLQDYVGLASSLSVTHLIIFNISACGPNMKLCRLPHGPTLTFRIEKHWLAREVLSTLKSQITYAYQFQTAPCLMTNLQPDDGENHLRLSAQMILDMFPNLNPSQVKLKDIRRCCLFNYDSEKEEFEFRHYSIRTRPIGISKAVKKLVSTRVPNMENLNEISDFVLKSELLSDSEGEEDPKNNVTLSELDTKGRLNSTKSSIKLSELGPKLNMKLIKIEEGLCSGTVLYHKYHSKLPEELLEIEKKKDEALKLKEKRRRQQMVNVQRKMEEKEKHKKRCLEGMYIKMGKKEPDANDDAQHYQEEVGEEPDQDLFQDANRGASKKENFKRRKISKV